VKGATFSREVKRELAGLPLGEEHCRRGELSGLLFGAGTFEIASGGQYALRVSLGLPAVARRLVALAHSFAAPVELRTVETAPLGLRYEVVLGDDPRQLQLLNETGVLSDSFRFQNRLPRRLVERRCCAVAFVRGAFLACGSVSSPGEPVHAEFTVEDLSLAEDLAALLRRLGLVFSLSERGRNVACYTKRGETAADLLATLGAHGARLRWEEHLVLGRVRERANRLANCDEANARRAAAAARRQVELAQALVADPRWPTLPQALREAAELRLRHPYLSLQELARKRRPPLTKSTLNHRFRRIEELVGR
jgi:DNA-binding protein WhiA